MFCAISGETPQDPVVSKKSGHVFEKRLIESYIRDNGVDPLNGEDLTIDDLVPLQNARSVKPRPPTLTSIPSLLSMFQNEWDALALETFTLRQQLQQARQELSTSLYENDAAIRVITRITRERDEARDALAKISLGDQTIAMAAGDTMDVDGSGLTTELKRAVDETQARLSKTRKKRPVPPGWATTDDIQNLTVTDPVSVLPDQGCALRVDGPGNAVWFAGATGYGACSLPDLQITQPLRDIDAPVTDIIVYGHDQSALQVLATATGEITIPGAGISLKSHKAPVTSLALHPSGLFFASTSLDKSFAFYDVESKREAVRHITNTALKCCDFHPDGHILAVGGQNGKVLVYATKDVEIAATLDHDSAITSLAFSENGIWLAVATENSTMVAIWHLGKIERIKSVDFGAQINQLKFDYTGQFLGGAGPNGVVVMHYDKAAKEWSEQLRRATPAASIEWGPQAKSIVVLRSDGGIQCTK